jgi:cytochrome c biogenesis protein
VQVAYLEGGETQTSWFVKGVPRLREKEIMGVPVRLNDIGDEFTTGLEVAADPGIWVVWTGFALILFGLYCNFFMCYRRIYLLRTSVGVLVAGTSSRNKEAFREEFEKWREKAHGTKR